ncbi:MAG: N-acetylmuramoyl-L-alanine amidase family protein [Bacillota bacterium]
MSRNGVPFKIFIVTYVVTALLVAGTPPTVYASSGIQLLIDGTHIIADVPPRIVGGRTLVPIRVVSESLGAKVDWDGSTRTVTVERAGTSLSLRIGEPTAVVNGKSVPLDVPPSIIDSRTMVPIRFVATALGAEVSWDEKTRTVRVDSPVAPPPATAGKLHVGSLSYEVTSEGVLFTVGGRGLQVCSVKTLEADGQVPHRLLLDFPGLVLALPYSMFPIEAGPVLRMRTGMVSTNPDVARLVFDLSEPVRYELAVSPSGESLSLLVRHIVTAVEVQSTRDGPVILVKATGPVSHRVSKLGDPPRLVVDIPGTTVSRDFPPILANNSEGIKKIRVGQFQVNPDIVRVVVETDNLNTYDVETTPEGLVISFLARINAMNWDSWSGGSRLTLDATGPVNAEVTKDKKRLVVTIPSTTWGLEETEFVVNQGNIAAIRVEERRMSPPSVTLEVDLLEDTSFSVVSSGQQGRVVVDIGGSNLLRGKRIMIDPGHGGSDPGAISYSGIYEKEFTLAISHMLREILEGQGAEVRMTRTGDQTVEVRDRVYMANAFRTDVLISVHANSFNDSSKRGIEVYHCSKLDTTIQLAEIMRDTLVKALGFEDRGVRKAMFLVLLETNMPSVLVETGYISNPQEEKLLRDPAFQRRVAEALSAGMIKYFTGTRS